MVKLIIVPNDLGPINWSFCTILNQTILSTAFPALMDAFNISTATVQWLTTGFLMVNGL